MAKSNPTPIEPTKAEIEAAEVQAQLAEERALLAKLTVTRHEMGRAQVGQWYGMSSAMKATNPHIYRCGLKGSERADAVCASMLRMGWRIAPSNVRCVGHEEDGDRLLAVWCSDEHFQGIKELDRKRISHTTRGDAWAAELDYLKQTTGAQVTVHKTDVEVDAKGREHVMRQEQVG